MDGVTLEVLSSFVIGLFGSYKHVCLWFWKMSVLELAAVQISEITSHLAENT